MAEEPRSRLDLKIARDKLVANLDPLWRQLCADVETTCAKIKDIYRLDLTVQIDPEDSVIHVSHTETPATEAERATEYILELHLDWKQKKLAACVMKRDSRGRDLQAGSDQPRSYPIVAETFSGTLRFFDGQELRSIDVVEVEIVEKLLHMNLDS